MWWNPTGSMEKAPCDIIVQDYSGNRVAVFEVKYDRSQEGLPKSCDEAAAQIGRRMYEEKLQGDHATVTCYGVSFNKKRCLVQLKEEKRK